MTIVSAYNKLKAEGYAYQKIGSGSYAKRKDVSLTFRKEYAISLKNIKNESLDDIIDFTGETNGEILFQ